MTAAGIDHTEHRRAIAALNAWGWAECERPDIYADPGPRPEMLPGKTPESVRERLVAAMGRRHG